MGSEMEEGREGLLGKMHVENCPGCRMDRKKEENRGIPYKEFLYVWIVSLCTALPISSLFPFLYFMIRDLHIAKRDEDIGFYAGFVGSAFMLGRALTSIFWGLVADHHGRKPVILISIISVIIFNTLFGLSTSYWMAIATRLLLGSFNGLLGPIKAYAIEVCGTEHQAIGLSLVSTAWGIGLIIGPAIGGYFAQPADKYPNIFPKESFFGRFPFFLPCSCISLFAVGVLISCFWLPETLHNHKDHDEETGGRNPAYKENLFKNWPLMSSIIVYCVFSLHDMAYTEIFSIWAVSDKIYGGLSFSSQNVGEVFAISGNYNHWLVHFAKQCCVSTPKRCCKWHFDDRTVTVQSCCSSLCRSYIFMGTKAPKCFLPSRELLDIVVHVPSEHKQLCCIMTIPLPAALPELSLRQVIKLFFSSWV